MAAWPAFRYIVAMTPTVSETDFEAEVLRSELPVLVFFMAEWAAPCKQIEPDVSAVAADLAGRAKVVAVDVDKSPRVAQALRVQGLPTFAVFQDGRPVALKAGPLRKALLREMIDPFLARQEGSVKPAELAELLKTGSVVAVDTREATSFERAHIPGAASFPADDIKNRLAELHMLQGDPILYCRTGIDSKVLAEELTAAGVGVAYLEGGFLAWEGEMLPVERPD